MRATKVATVIFLQLVVLPACNQHQQAATMEGTADLSALEFEQWRMAGTLQLPFEVTHALKVREKFA